jgi:hypothetical protein
MHAQAMLQLLHAAADSRLRHAEPQCGRGKSSALHDCDEGTEILELVLHLSFPRSASKNTEVFQAEARVATRRASSFGIAAISEARLPAGQWRSKHFENQEIDFMELARRNFMRTSAAVAVAAAATPLLTACGGEASAATPPPFPQIADTSQASPDLVSFITAYFTAKTNRDLNATMSFFSPQLITYFDSTLGLDMNFDALKAIFAQFMPNWPNGSMSYPTRIVGDMNGAFIASTNTPELFGGEMRVFASVDIKDGKIVRWLDFWDSRSWPNLYGLQKSGITTTHASAVGENAATSLKTVAAKLVAAFSQLDAATAASLFSYDAVFEDIVLRTEVIGRSAIQRYLARALPTLPYGTGVTLAHVAGSASGGSVEWLGGSATALKLGLTGLVLDGSGLISRMTTVYDGALVGSGIGALAAMSIDP